MTGSNNKDSSSAENSMITTAVAQQQELILTNLRRVGMLPKDQPRHATLRRASVLVPLFWDRQGTTLHVLLNQRSKSLRTHPGWVCFPGGKQDSEDCDDDVMTALREAKEEIGLDPDHVEPLCRLPTLESKTGLCVTPVVGLVTPSSAVEPTSLTLQKDEVEVAFSVPLLYFADESNIISMEQVEWSRGGTFLMKTYNYAHEIGNSPTFEIKGLTAHILQQVAKIASGIAEDKKDDSLNS